MLLNLTVKNSFAHKHTVVKFEKGINYILGKNESGKSELLEMILYALYGSSALRGAASDYKDLEVTLTFKVKDQIYIVDRSKKTSLSEVEIKADGTTSITVVANSKTAVNTAITEKLGYTLDVFNKINFSKQLESTAHSSATKSARLDLKMT
jgi:DNA repair exonuclease SbcCD ATPase subunit